jgi:integrase
LAGSSRAQTLKKQAIARGALAPAAVDVSNMGYTTTSYRRAIACACKRAGVPQWFPHQLRHSAATRLRKEFGLDAARAVLGHSSPVVTEVYAELDSAKAAEVMAKIG